MSAHPDRTGIAFVTRPGRRFRVARPSEKPTRPKEKAGATAEPPAIKPISVPITIIQAIRQHWQRITRVDDFTPASSRVKGVAIGARKKLSTERESSGVTAEIVAIVAVRDVEKIFWRSCAAAWKNCSRRAARFLRLNFTVLFAIENPSRQIARTPCGDPKR
jgi:hypothetical protein